jgi:hypothetical protein
VSNQSDSQRDRLTSISSCDTCLSFGSEVSRQDTTSTESDIGDSYPPRPIYGSSSIEQAYSSRKKLFSDKFCSAKDRFLHKFRRNQIDTPPKFQEVDLFSDIFMLDFYSKFHVTGLNSITFDQPGRRVFSTLTGLNSTASTNNMEEAVFALRQGQHVELENKPHLNLQQSQLGICDPEIIQEKPHSRAQVRQIDGVLEKAERGEARKISSLLQNRPNFSTPKPFLQQLDLIEHCQTSSYTAAQTPPAKFNEDTDETAYFREEVYNAMLGMHLRLSPVDESRSRFDFGYDIRLHQQQAKLLVSALNEIRDHAQCKTSNCKHRYRARASDSTIGEARSLEQIDEVDSVREEWYKSPAEALEAIERSWAIVEGLKTGNNEGQGKKGKETGSLRQPQFRVARPVQGWNMRINSEWDKLENGMTLSSDFTTRRERKKETKSWRPLNNIRTFLEEKRAAESKLENAERPPRGRQERVAENFHHQPMQFIWSVDGSQQQTYGIEAMRMLSEKARREGRMCSWIMY